MLCNKRRTPCEPRLAVHYLSLLSVYVIMLPSVNDITNFLEIWCGGYASLNFTNLRNELDGCSK